jgi:hypothetical protein
VHTAKLDAAEGLSRQPTALPFWSRTLTKQWACKAIGWL